MRYALAGALALGTILSATPAAAITVDGLLDASGYGAAVTVGQSDTAPEGNFGTPTNQARAGYSIRLAGADGFVYGFFQTDGTGTTVDSFANLYFDLDYQTRSGSDLGFEINGTRVNAFVPASGQKVENITGAQVSVTATTVEFALPVAFFTGPISGLDTYNAALVFPAAGASVRLNLSQSFSYSVAGGTSYGTTRLGTAELTTAAAGAVPEPTSWAMMALGFGLVGAAVRRRRAVFAPA